MNSLLSIFGQHQFINELSENARRFTTIFYELII
jgi:hypothetical protein